MRNGTSSSSHPAPTVVPPATASQKGAESDDEYIRRLGGKNSGATPGKPVAAPAGQTDDDYVGKLKRRRDQRLQKDLTDALSGTGTVDESNIDKVEAGLKSVLNQLEGAQRECRSRTMRLKNELMDIKEQQGEVAKAFERFQKAVASQDREEIGKLCSPAWLAGFPPVPDSIRTPSPVLCAMTFAAPETVPPTVL